MGTNILVVDDEPLVREMLMSTLASEGYACAGAGNADEAGRLLAGKAFDLALIDIIMPGESGVQVLHAIKQQSPETAAIMITAIDNIETALFCIRLGAYEYITKPFNIDRVLLSVRNALENRKLLLENRAYQAGLERQVQKQTVKINDTLADLNLSYEHTLLALARALDARERETGCHSERVRNYALHLARTIGMAEPDLSNLAKGALLHDLGKIGVPDSILLKPGKLDDAEWVEMRRHPGVGYDIVAGVPFLRGAAEIILSHHERYDGQGYPQGLKGETIPLGARIFALVDTLDAMTSDRPYRKALPFQAVIEEVRRCSGTQFDPRIVTLFLSQPQSRWEDIAQKRLT